MLQVLLQILGFFIYRFIYGQNCKKPSFGISYIAIIFWLLSLILLITNSAANDFILCLVCTILFLVVIIIWKIIVKTKGYNGNDNIDN